MANQLNSASLTPLRTATAARLAAVAMVALLAGCSSVPDAVNPVEWYKGARDMVSGDDGKAEAPENGEAPNRVVAERGQPAPGADESIPDLNTVPEQRPQAATRIERERIQRGLVADRESARRYSSEVVRRQGDPVNPLNTSPQAVSPPAEPSSEPQARSQQARQPEEAPAPPARPRPPVEVEPAPPQPSPETSAQSSPRASPQASPPPRQPDPADSAPPAPPQMAAVPPPEEAPQPSTRLMPVPSFSSADDGGTVIVSSAGVQNSGSLRTMASAPAQAPTSVSSESGARPLAEFDPSGRRGSYQVATIQFANGSSALNARDKAILRQVAVQQRQLGGTVRVVGHASSRTRALDMVRHKMVNFQVSAARADAVARELIRNGMDPNELFVGAVSDRDPKFHEFMPTGEAGNRRAEIFIDF